METILEHYKYSQLNIPDASVSIEFDTNLDNNQAELNWQSKKWHHKYFGNFIKQCQHGEGTFKWIRDNQTIVYEGKLYANNLHGYGRITYPDGALFEGLFKMNCRFGPGIYSAANGEQDVGLWDGKHLKRLSQVVYEEWVPQIGISPIGRTQMLRYRKLVSIDESYPSIAERLLKSIDAKSELIQRSDELYLNDIRDPNSLFFNKRYFDKLFYGDKNNLVDVIVPVDNISTRSSDSSIVSIPLSIYSESELEIRRIAVTELLAWNNNMFCINVLTHAFKNRNSESYLADNIHKMLIGDREEFRKAGQLESCSVHFLKYCSEGKHKMLLNLVSHKYQVDPNVSDAHGNTGVIYAVSRDQCDTLNVLEGIGANFNDSNDEGLTPLNIALLRYIAVKYDVSDWESAFLPRIACSNRLVNLSRLKRWHMTLFPTAHVDLTVQKSFISNKTLASILTEPTLRDHDAYSLESDVKPFLNFQNTYQIKANGKVENCLFNFQPIIINRTSLPKKNNKRKNKVKEPIKRHDETNPESNEIFLQIVEQTIFEVLKCGAVPDLSLVPYPAIIISLLTNRIIVEKLLDYKANPNIRTERYLGFLTPLHVLVALDPHRDLLGITDLLLKNGANPNLRADECYWNEFKTILHHPKINNDFLGLTPLQMLCVKQNYDNDLCGYFLYIAKQFLKYNGNPNLKYLGHNSLTMAMLNGNTSLIRVLLESSLVDPNQVLDLAFGCPLTLFINNSYCDFLPIDRIKCVMDIVFDYGANPLNYVFVDYNALEFVNEILNVENKETDFAPSTTILKKSNRNKHSISTKRRDFVKNDSVNKKMGTLNELTKYLDMLVHLVLTRHICGNIIHRIYKIFQQNNIETIDTELETLTKQVQIPTFETTVDIFRKMADAKYDLIPLFVEKTLAFTLNKYHPHETVNLCQSFQSDKECKRLNPKHPPQYPKYCKNDSSSTNSLKQSDSELETLTKASLANDEVDNLQNLAKYICQLIKKEEKEELNMNMQSKSRILSSVSAVLPVIITHPESDIDVDKYFVCFECHLKRGKILIWCPHCHLVQFCSQLCNAKSVRKHTGIHLCQDVFYDRIAIEMGLKSPESLKLTKPVKQSNSDELRAMKAACDKCWEQLLQLGGLIDLNSLIYPFCAMKDDDFYYHLKRTRCLFPENYSLV